MFCKKCGKQIKDFMKYCPYCGDMTLNYRQLQKENAKHFFLNTKLGYYMLVSFLCCVFTAFSFLLPFFDIGADVDYIKDRQKSYQKNVVEEYKDAFEANTSSISLFHGTLEETKKYISGFEDEKDFDTVDLFTTIEKGCPDIFENDGYLANEFEITNILYESLLFTQHYHYDYLSGGDTLRTYILITVILLFRILFLASFVSLLFVFFIGCSMKESKSIPFMHQIALTNKIFLIETIGFTLFYWYINYNITEAFSFGLSIWYYIIVIVVCINQFYLIPHISKIQHAKKPICKCKKCLICGKEFHFEKICPSCGSTNIREMETEIVTMKVLNSYQKSNTISRKK